MKRNYLVLSFLLFLVGCGVLGILTPKTFNEKVAVAKVTVTGVREAATTLLVAQKITSADAQNAQDQADVARKGIDVAMQIHDADPTDGDGRLEAAIVGLNAIKGYLCDKSPNEPLCKGKP